MQKVRNIFVVLALMALSVMFGFRWGENGLKTVAGDGGDKLDLSLMWVVKDKLSKAFLEREKMNDRDLQYGAIAGMVSSLGDPYTVFLPPRANKQSNEELAGEFGGVGISLGYKDGVLAVMSPLAKTPAEKAGLRPGDLILRIIDKNKKLDRETNGIALDEAVDFIRGKVGTEITLKIYKGESKKTVDVILKREVITVPSIELVWKEAGGKKVAWIRLYKFTDLLFTEWPEIVEEINSQKKLGNYGGIVLDVRNNPGGFLQASVLVASDFIKEGVVVKQASSTGKVETLTVDKSRGKLLNDKMVVLVNGGSASASEILAGALRDHQRAKLVGEKTFGKGTVQQPEDFPDGSGLHVTIAKWLLPSGKNIHKEGVDPDVEVKYEEPKTEIGVTPTPVKDVNNFPDNQLDKAIEVLLDS